MWPFSKKKDTKSATPPEEHEAAEPLEPQPEGTLVEDKGPYDGDTVNPEDYDFSDFAKGGLDLGSMLIPVVHQGEVQVEMGDSGPQMIHILTPVGRITPVAFAAPRHGGFWEESIEDIVAGMKAEGLDVTVESGQWGSEIKALSSQGALRVIAVEKSRWLLRFSLASTHEDAENLRTIAVETMARSFVRRGKDPLPAGQPLPVTIPAPMVQELNKALEYHRQQNSNNPQNTQGVQEQPEVIEPAPRYREGTSQQQLGRQLGDEA